MPRVSYRQRAITHFTRKLAETEQHAMLEYAFDSESEDECYDGDAESEGGNGEEGSFVELDAALFYLSASKDLSVINSNRYFQSRVQKKSKLNTFEEAPLDYLFK